MIVVIDVVEDGIQFGYSKTGDVIDILTPEWCVDLIYDIRRNLFEWSKLTGKQIDWEKHPNETNRR